MDELRRIIEDSEVMAEDDALWPQPGIKTFFGDESIHLVVYNDMITN